MNHPSVSPFLRNTFSFCVKKFACTFCLAEQGSKEYSSTTRSVNNTGVGLLNLCYTFARTEKRLSCTPQTHEFPAVAPRPAKQNFP